MSAKKLHLSFSQIIWDYFDLPSIVFKAESLKELYLDKCRINPLVHSNHVPLSKHLHTFSLKQVYIVDETFEKIMSSCPLIEHVTLDRCKGLMNIKVHLTAADYNLKRFSFWHYIESLEQMDDDDDSSVEIEVLSIETITIACSPNWFYQHKHFPNLTRLILEKVRFNSKSFEILSCDFPNLRDFTLTESYGFEEFHLLSHSIKSVVIDMYRWVNKATFDVPNIVRFEYEGYIPQSLSFTKFNNAGHEWKSYIRLMLLVDSSWFLNLYAMLNALSQSETHLHLLESVFTNEPGPLPYGCILYEPVVVELLQLNLRRNSFMTHRYSNFMNHVFCICRPTIISGPTQGSTCEVERELSDFQYQILVMEGRGKHHFWQRDLDDVSMETFDKNANEWNPVRWKGLSESTLRSIRYTRLIQLRLKWRNYV